MKARKLIIMRHGTAESDGPSDHARKLTPHGVDEARKVGLRLSADGVAPTHVLCSTALRCRETWEAVSSEFGFSGSVHFDDRLYNAGRDSLLVVLSELEDLDKTAGDDTILLLAHNPGVSYLALELARPDESAATVLRSGFAPGSFACFGIEGAWQRLAANSAQLMFFVRTPSDKS